MRRLLLVVVASLAVLIVPTAESRHRHKAGPPTYVAAWGFNEHNNTGIGHKSKALLKPITTAITGNPEEVVTGGWWGAARTGCTVKTWGGNEQGQAGDGKTSVAELTAHTVEGPVCITKLAGSGEHELVLLADGRVATWGGNTYGQAGLGFEGSRKTAVVTHLTVVPGVTNAVAVVTSGANDFVLLSDGTVLCWGEDSKGQCGDNGSGRSANKDKPVLVKGLSGVKQISAGGSAASGSTLFAVLTDGTVKSIGLNNQGQLGAGTSGSSATFVTVKGLTNVKEISSNLDHSIALLNDGSAMAWGDDNFGQLAAKPSSVCHSSKVLAPCSLVPIPVTALKGKISVVAAGVHTTLAVVEGKLMAIGQNEFGELGDGTKVNKSSPVAVLGNLQNITDLAGGNMDSFAITTTKP